MKLTFDDMRDREKFEITFNPRHDEAILNLIFDYVDRTSKREKTRD